MQGNLDSCAEMKSRMPRRDDKRQGGIALIALLAIVGVIGLVFLFNGLTAHQIKSAHEAADEEKLNQAKEALVGFSATYRDGHSDEVFGFLPCPDTDNDGDAEGGCAIKDVSVVGRLPWKRLGIPALRDSGSECLWYAVSGRAKDNPKTTSAPGWDTFNWDTLGQFIVQDFGGNVLAGANAHDRPFAVILAPRTPIAAQNRAVAGASECGGNIATAAYLDGSDVIYSGTPAANNPSTITVATAESARNATNNDRGLWVTNKDIFDRVKKRSDFKTDIDSMMVDLTNCLNGLTPASLPAMSATFKGMENVITQCPAFATKKQNVLNNWKDNLLYKKQASSVNGIAGCNAVLIFGGERTTNQSRDTPAKKGDTANFGDPAMYLEAPNAAAFASTGNYFGPTYFDSSNPSADVVRCITGIPPGATQVSFASAVDWPRFVAAGVGVSTDTTNRTVTISDAAGTGGGCFWFPDPIPLAGKTLRAYYDFSFSQADPYAVTGSGTDRGNGFTFQMVRSDLGSPTGTCGTETNMGALVSSDAFGTLSYILETDVHKDASKSDPTPNHTAILAHGNLTHSVTNGNATTACNGTTSGCAHTPADKLEESPGPALHSQRIDIYTGCNSSCSACNPSSHVAPNTYARIGVAVDCTECADVSSDSFRSERIAATVDRDFSAMGNWTGTNWAVSAGKLVHAAGATAASLPNSALIVPPIPSAPYSIGLTATTTIAGTLTLSFGSTSSLPISLLPGATSISIPITAAGTGALTLTADASWVGSVDNVSVIAYPSIASDLYRSERIAAPADRDFSAPGNWTGTNWTVATGKFTHSAGANPAVLPNTALVAPPVPLKTYVLGLSANTTAAGTLTVSFGDTASAPISLSPGIMPVNVSLTASGTGPLKVIPSATWAGSIDNVTVMEPNMFRCIALDTEMNSFYFAFTGGFRSGTAAQSVTLRSFILRTE